jgi:hypothetical protein
MVGIHLNHVCASSYVICSPFFGVGVSVCVGVGVSVCVGVSVFNNSCVSLSLCMCVCGCLCVFFYFFSLVICAFVC